MKALVGFFVLTVLSAFGGEELTFTNPIDLAYRLRPEEKANFREGADPEIVLHDGRYWLFASKCGGYFVSDDLAQWRLVKTDDLPLEEYAPTVVEIDGRLHFSSRGGTVWRAVDPLAGKWEKIPGRIPSVDSALFLDDDGRLYDYEGGTSKKPQPIGVWEIDPKTFSPKPGDPVACFTADRTRYGYEVCGDGNEMVASDARRGCLEGGHMLKRNGRYYFQFAGPATEFSSYCDTALVGDTPKGPFVRQRLNPFSFKPFGYAKGAGHGATFRDKFGNTWHVTTCTFGGVDRRIVIFPVFFDPDGEMWCDTAFADWPLAIPNGRCESPEAYHTGWMPLCDGKSATASSHAASAGRAADCDARTNWAAAGGAGEWLRIDLGGLAEVRAVQICLAECDAYDAWRKADAARSWRVEATEDGTTWRTVAEGVGPNDHAYRVFAAPERATALRVVCTSLPEGARFAVRDLRAFGRMDKPLPEAPTGLKVVRDAGDLRHVELAWAAAPESSGYLVRYGPTSEKMHLSHIVRSATKLTLRNLDAKESYCWSVAAYNEAGFSKQTAGEVCVGTLAFPAVASSYHACVEEALADAHSNLVERLIGSDGLLLDYRGELPTPKDCAEGRPNALGWFSPIENGPMFTGPYLRAMCERARRTGLAEDRALCARLAAGLVKAASVSDVPGMVVRGMGTDGRCHYPLGSEDQTLPWFFGLHAYATSGFVGESERAAVVRKMDEVAAALEANDWACPCDGSFRGQNRGGFRGVGNMPFRAATHYLFILRAMADATGSPAWMEKYRKAAKEMPKGVSLTRLQICEEGWVLDLLHFPVEASYGHWIYVCAQGCLREMARLETDPKLRAAYERGLARNAEHVADKLTFPLAFDNNRAEVPFKFANWRTGYRWRVQKTQAEAAAVAETGDKAILGERRLYERCQVTGPLSIAATLAYAGNPNHRESVVRAICHFDYSAINLGEFFLAEVAWYALSAGNAP